MQTEGLYYEIGIRRASRVIIANEVVGSPACQEIENALREYAPAAEFDGAQITARCAVGSEHAEIIGHTNDPTLEAALKRGAVHGADMMGRLIRSTEDMNIGVVAKALMARADLTKPIPTKPEEIHVTDDPFSMGDLAGPRYGMAFADADGVRITVPGIPRGFPMADWANQRIRERYANAILAELATRSGPDIS